MLVGYDFHVRVACGSNVRVHDLSSQALSHKCTGTPMHAWWLLPLWCGLIRLQAGESHVSAVSDWGVPSHANNAAKHSRSIALELTVQPDSALQC